VYAAQFRTVALQYLNGSAKFAAATMNSEGKDVLEDLIGAKPMR
jgi:hypothetical protein